MAEIITKLKGTEYLKPHFLWSLPKKPSDKEKYTVEAELSE